MLISCPECSLQVSDKAISCPHCGYPMIKTEYNRPQQSRRKHRRLPNGFGQITQIKNRNLRKPFRAMVTVGKNPENGKYIVKPLKPDCYFATYNEAYEALLKYNKNPYDLIPTLKLRELYDEWFTKYRASFAANSGYDRTIESAWKHCSSIYEMRVIDLRARHIKRVIEDVESPNMKSRVKSMFNLMLDYALEYELVDKNYARTFVVSDDVLEDIENQKVDHIPYTDKEMEILWKHYKEVPYADIMLIQCYSGWRPQELGLIELADTDLENWTFTGGMKTDAGFNRTVPIHPAIRDMVSERYRQAVAIGSKYLFNAPDAKTHRGSYMLTYDKYRYRYNNAVEVLGLNHEHRPHDGRKHFVTMAKNADVDEYAIKRMVGHKIDDITEKIYTERRLEWLQEQIAKIKTPCI